MARLLLKVKCPYCGWERGTHSVNHVVCFKCEKGYALYPKKKKSRVVGILKGSPADLRGKRGVTP